MKKLLLIPLILGSCVTHKQYSPYKLKKISKDIMTLREFVNEDYLNNEIDEKIARNYYNLLEVFASQIDMEVEKAKELKKTKVYKLITITKR